jgi:HSP20 family protein
MLRDFDRFFEEGWTPLARTGGTFGEFGWVPALEVVEKENRLIARLDLPGVKKEEIAVSITDEALTIEGERKFEEEEKKNNWYRSERTYGKFVRTVLLPAGVKTADIKATFLNGVLEIVVPLPIEAAAVPPRKVEIAGGEEKKTVKAA